MENFNNFLNQIELVSNVKLISLPDVRPVHQLIAKSKSYSVVPQKIDVKEKLQRLNALEKENRTSIDQTSSEEENENVSIINLTF